MPQAFEPGPPATYAVGDLHGEVSLLRGLLARLPLRDRDTLMTGGNASWVACLESPLHQPSAPAIRDACDRLNQVWEALHERVEWGTIT